MSANRKTLVEHSDLAGPRTSFRHGIGVILPNFLPLLAKVLLHSLYETQWLVNEFLHFKNL